MECHLCNFLQNRCIMYSFVWIFPPVKWCMTMNQYTRYSKWFFVLEGLYNYLTCLPFIVILHFFFCHTTCTWNRSIKVVCLRCAKCRNSSTCLCPARCP